VGPAALRALSDQGRLFDAQHLDAVVPGEAAAFVALVDPVRAGGMALARLAGAGGATTEATPFDEAPVTGDALVEAMRAAMAAGGAEAPAGWVLADSGYEGLRLREWEIAQVRARALLGVPYRWDALPQRVGRAGAAHLPLAVAIATASFELGHVPAESVLATAGTDAGRRGAVWLRAAGALQEREA
jgi:3-oxoacyl-[acyl-carrier-protein] synthase-1